MILNWTSSDIVTLRAATAPLSATSLLAYSSTLPAVKKHLLDWKLQLSTPTPAVAAAPNLRQIGMDFKNGRFRSVVVCCYTGLRFYFWGGGQFCYRGGWAWGIAIYIEQIIGSFYLLFMTKAPSQQMLAHAQQQINRRRWHAHPAAATQSARFV